GVPGREASGCARYRAALPPPGALSFAVPGVIGRLPMGMFSLAQVMLVVAVTGRYGVAGAVSALGALAFAAVTPYAARLADRVGPARVLRPLVMIFAASTAAFAVCAVGHAPVWTLFLTGCLSRGTMPALGSMVRTRWSRLLPGSSLLDAAFSLEGIADEIIFIAGPVLVVALVTDFHPVAAGPVPAVLSRGGGARERGAERGGRRRADRAAAHRAAGHRRGPRAQQHVAQFRAPGADRDARMPGRPVRGGRPGDRGVRAGARQQAVRGAAARP